MKLTFEKLIEYKEGVSSATGKAWKMQSALFTTTGEYPKKALFEFWNDVAASIQKVKPGTECDIDFNIEASEWKGVWYNKLKAWKFTANVKQTVAANRTSQSAIPQQPDNEDDSSDLPF